MNENLDLIKILDGCPEGTEFYSDTFGKLFFFCIKSEINPYRVMFKDCHDIKWAFTEKGTYYTNEDSKCSISVFPGKEQRDWSKFERFWDKPKTDRFDPKTLKPFDKVLVKTGCSKWTVSLFSFVEGEYVAVTNNARFPKCIPFNEDTKYLLGTGENAPQYYRYWED